MAIVNSIRKIYKHKMFKCKPIEKSGRKANWSLDTQFFISTTLINFMKAMEEELAYASYYNLVELPGTTAELVRISFLMMKVEHMFNVVIWMHISKAIVMELTVR